MTGGAAHTELPLVVSVNVGLPRPLAAGERVVQSGIVKTPVPGRVHAGKLGLAGDGQADLRVHGGEGKAVYAYPSEHYAGWRGDLGRDDLDWGAFGENLTLRGIAEADVHEGDVLRVGSAQLVVTTPRQPCFKLAARMGTSTVIRRMWETGRCGFYLAVAQPGEMGAGDVVALERCGGAVSVAAAFAARRPAKL